MSTKAKVAKPQSAPAITRGCSTKLVVESMTPGIRILASGIFAPRRFGDPRADRLTLDVDVDLDCDRHAVELALRGTLRQCPVGGEGRHDRLRAEIDYDRVDRGVGGAHPLEMGAYHLFCAHATVADRARRINSGSLPDRCHHFFLLYNLESLCALRGGEQPEWALVAARSSRVRAPSREPAGGSASRRAPMSRE